jgi:hypothetical protein
MPLVADQFRNFNAVALETSARKKADYGERNAHQYVPNGFNYRLKYICRWLL